MIRINIDFVFLKTSSVVAPTVCLQQALQWHHFGRKHSASIDLSLVISLSTFKAVNNVSFRTPQIYNLHFDAIMLVTITWQTQEFARWVYTSDTDFRYWNYVKGAIHCQLKWTIILCDVIPDEKVSKLRSFDSQ